MGGHVLLIEDEPNIIEAIRFILSPHRAAAVPGGRHLIGRMILDDLAAISERRPERRLLRADARYAEKQAGVGDAKSVGRMAADRARGT